MQAVTLRLVHLSLCLAASHLTAQDAIPVRRLGPIVATSTENVGVAPSVRATANGTVIVGSNARYRVLVMDSMLNVVRVIRDSTAGTSSRGIPSGLVPYLGDSTLVPEEDGVGLALLDPSGNPVRVIAPPRANDMGHIGWVGGGRTAIDAKGRIVYRAAPPLPALINGKRSPSSDSSPLVRGDFDTRVVETIGWVKNPFANRGYMKSRPDPAGGPPIQTSVILFNPFRQSDEWAVLSDGSIAMVRVGDYHIDWIDPDGARRSTPKIPMDWRAYTDEEKRHIADSVLESARERQRAYLKSHTASSTGEQSQSGAVEFGLIPDSEFPSFWPPLQVGSAIPDLDGHLWILPTTSKLAIGGFTYDVIDRSGKIFERVQVPMGRVIAGFGPGGQVFLSHTEGGETYLERATWKGGKT